jgi:putative endonuclease
MAAERSPRQRLGADAEAAARAYLEARGLVFVAANWRGFAEGAGRCELDLVMRHGELAVIVEVRAQRLAGKGFAGHPAHTVGPAKRARVTRAGLAWWRAMQREAAGGWRPRTLRFDVVTALAQEDGVLALRWYPNAFEATED